MRETLTEDESFVAFAATLAQCEDVHALAWSLTGEQQDAASALLSRMESGDLSTPVERALAKSLTVLVHDVDHPDLPEDEWAALEALHADLSTKYGHTPQMENA